MLTDVYTLQKHWRGEQSCNESIAVVWACRLPRQAFSFVLLMFYTNVARMSH